MDIVIKDGSIFRKIINCMKDLTDSAEFVLESEGITMQSRDKAKVCLIDLVLESDTFLKYKIPEIESNEQFRLGINFINFNNILKLSKSQQISITQKAGITDKVMLQLNENNNKKIQFDMVLTTVDQTEFEIPEINYLAQVYIDSSELQTSIKDLSTFGKRCKITVNENEIFLSVTGDAGTGEISILNTKIEWNGEESGEINSEFNIKYINSFSKAGLSDEVVLKFGPPGVPFCFEYQLEYGYMRFYLGEFT
jgi:proliferating cell nuclear antigen